MLASWLLVPWLSISALAQEAVVQGVPAGQYWQGLHYQESDGWGFHLSSVSDTPVPGTDAIVKAEIFLFPDGKYAADWQELKPAGAGAMGGSAYDNVGRKFPQGTWSVSGDGSLVLSGLGVATGMSWNGMPGCNLRVDAAPGSLPATGLTVPLQKVYSSYTLYGLRYQMQQVGATPNF